MIGGIQPSRIVSLVRAAFSGELDDGLIQRLQLAVYPDDVREWRLVDRWPNKAAAERVDWVIEQLDQIPDPRSRSPGLGRTQVSLTWKTLSSTW